MNRSDRIFVAGHRGLVGSAIVRRLHASGYDNLVLRTRAELDLRQPDAVEAFFTRERPNYVFLAAARVGGIIANDVYPADFIRENLLIQVNVIHSSHQFGVSKLLFLGSSCIYPKHAPQPIREEYLLEGSLEPTNQAYAIAKIAGIEMLDAYRRQFGMRGICVMPPNLYGPNDNFDLQHSHVLPALMRRFHEAKRDGLAEVAVWGTGSPRREFLHVDDLADACLLLMESDEQRHVVNVGTGEDLTIGELAGLVREVVGFRGHLRFDPTKPDGTPRKLLDVSRMQALGWRAKIPLLRGLAETYRWYVENCA